MNPLEIMAFEDVRRAGEAGCAVAALSADLARHPWANLPVRVTLSVRDGIDQTAAAPPTAMILPGRRFFDPLAAGLVEPLALPVCGLRLAPGPDGLTIDEDDNLVVCHVGFGAVWLFSTDSLGLDSTFTSP